MSTHRRCGRGPCGSWWSLLSSRPHTDTRSPPAQTAPPPAAATPRSAPLAPAGLGGEERRHQGAGLRTEDTGHGTIISLSFPTPRVLWAPLPSASRFHFSHLICLEPGPSHHCSSPGNSMANPSPLPPSNRLSTLQIALQKAQMAGHSPAMSPVIPV